MSEDDSRYPRGKLNAADEGELQIRMFVRDRTVIVDFGKAVHWLGFDAATARTLARTLLARADEITGQQEDTKGVRP